MIEFNGIDSEPSPTLWKLREDHDRFCRGEIVSGIPVGDRLRTDAVISCFRQNGKTAVRMTPVRMTPVPLYKLARYEMPKPPEGPDWWRERTTVRMKNGSTIRVKGVDDDRLDALRTAGVTSWEHSFRWTT